MTMTRGAATVYLTEQFGVIDAAVGTDLSAYSGDVDMALRRLGVSESGLTSATIADADRGAFLALSEYYALRRFSRKLALMIDIGVDNVGTWKESQMFAHVKALLGEAANTAAGYGYPVDASPSWSIGSLNLDFLEPEVE